MWQNGKRNGEGRIIYPDGTVKSGTWENDKKVDGNDRDDLTPQKSRNLNSSGPLNVR